jgi:hypothetical protein
MGNGTPGEWQSSQAPFKMSLLLSQRALRDLNCLREKMEKTAILGLREGE